MKQGKIVISNIIMMLISIAAIVTLIIGSFWKIQMTLHVNGETLSELQGGSTENAKTAEGTESGESGTETGGNAAAEEILKQIDVSLPLSFDFKSMNLIKAVASDPTEQIREGIARQVGGVVDSLMSAVDKLMSAMVNIVIDQTVKQAEESVKQKIAEESGGEVTEEQIKQELNDKYGVTDEDVDTLKKEVSDTMTALLNGETDDASKCLEESETLEKLALACAREQWKNENPDATEEPTDQQLAEQAQQTKAEVIDAYNQMIEEMEVDGKIGKETVLVKALEKADLKDDAGNPVKFENADDVKAFLADKLNSKIDDNTARILGIALKVMGGFVLLVIAAWAYFLIKLVVKTLFCQNKTVGMFAPRFFGWMPHVLFVGLPMLVFGNMDRIIAKTSGTSLQQLGETLAKLSSLVSVKITSLTWVSALATVVLLAIWIPYYQWRRKLKREIKGR